MDRETILTIGFVGVGRFGKRLLKLLLDLVQGEAIRVVAVDEKPVEDLGIRGAQLTFRQAEAAAVTGAPGVDAVMVVTQGDAHHDIAKRALLSGKHVYVEKPFALTDGQARELVSLAAERNLVLMAGHTLLYDPVFQRLKRLVAEGGLGRIRRLEACFQNPARIGIDLTTSVLEDLGYHELYMIHDLLGMDLPFEVREIRESRTGQTLHLALAWNGVDVVIDVSREHPEEQNRTLTVHGEESSIVFDHSSRAHGLFCRSDRSGNRECGRATEADRMAPAGSVEQPLDLLLRAFLDAVRSRRPPLTPGESAVPVVRTMQRIGESLRRAGQPETASDRDCSLARSTAG